ncbi:MAG TPA: carboxypeptidase-like regulatory domain-containing protein, partial [Pyrinomonadaceae bacterium]|nr:carboxypeptidase-like regulatory domain-containing protein [Pyrinomonadaceae bacterium]
MKYRSQMLFGSILSLPLIIFLFIPAAGQVLRSITVITEPNATVWIDDMRFGTTDDKGRLKISSVPAGVRVLRVRAEGFSEVRKSLPATTSGDVNVALT